MYWLLVLTVGLIFILQVPVLRTRSIQQLHPLSFGEGIALDPLPPKEIRWVGFDVTSVQH